MKKSDLKIYTNYKLTNKKTGKIFIFMMDATGHFSQLLNATENPNNSRGTNAVYRPVTNVHNLEVLEKTNGFEIPTAEDMALFRKA